MRFASPTARSNAASSSGQRIAFTSGVISTEQRNSQSENPVLISGVNPLPRTYTSTGNEKHVSSLPNFAYLHRADLALNNELAKTATRSAERFSASLFFGDTSNALLRADSTVAISDIKQ